MDTTASTDTTMFDQLAWSVAIDGISAHELEVARLLATVDARSGHGTLLGSVGDRSLSAALRERALGHLLVALARRSGSPSLAHAA